MTGRPPRIVHLIGGAGLGGIETGLLGLVRATDLDRYASEVWFFLDGPLAADFATIVPTRLLVKARRLDLRFLVRLLRALRTERPDIVCTWGPTPNLWAPWLARLAGVPHVVMSDASLESWRPSWRSRAYRISAIAADRFVGNAVAVLEAAAAGGVRRDHLVVIPCPLAPGLEPGASRDPDEILVFGRLSPLKGQDVLLRALPEVLARRPTARLTVVGGAALPEERVFSDGLSRLAKELGIDERVDFVGSSARPFDYLRRAGVVVVPSRSEGLPNSLLEAVACGAPIVATAVGGIPEVIEDGVTGALVQPDDPTALATAVIGVLEDPGAAARLAAVARDRVTSRHCPASVSREWSRLFDELTGQR